MIWLLGSGLVAAVAVIAAAGTAAWFFARRAIAKEEKFSEVLSQLFDAQRVNQRYEIATDKLRMIVDRLTGEKEREIDARKAAEQQRDYLRSRLVEIGDASAVADDIRHNVDRIKQLRKAQVSDDTQ